MLTTRDRILEVAARLFAERGYDGVSVRDIIGPAKANLGAVTYHFGSKEALFGAVVDRQVEPLRRLGEEIYRGKDRPDEKLRRMLTTYAFFILNEKPELRAFFVEMLAGAKHLPPVAIEGVKWRNRIFGEVVRQGIREGIFRPCDVECAAWIFFGMLSAYILYDPVMLAGRRGGYSRRYVDRVVKAALDVFMNGVLARARGSRKAGRMATRRLRGPGGTGPSIGGDSGFA
jgi:TetR/AcrR family transcriptional regulator